LFALLLDEGGSNLVGQRQLKKILRLSADMWLQRMILRMDGH